MSEPIHTYSSGRGGGKSTKAAELLDDALLRGKRVVIVDTHGAREAGGQNAKNVTPREPKKLPPHGASEV